MPQKNQKTPKSQEGDTGQTCPGTTSSQEPTCGGAQKPGKKGRNRGRKNKQNLQPKKQDQTTKLAPEESAATSQDGISQPANTQTGESSTTPRANYSGNNARNSNPSRRRVPSGSIDKSSKNPIPSREQSFSLPLMTRSPEVQSHQPRNRSGPGKIKPISPPLYYRTTGPLLPYDIDGVSPSEQLEIVRNRTADNSVHDISPRASQTPHAMIQGGPAYWLRLQSFLLSRDDLQKYGYYFQPLSEEQLDRKKRCGACGIGMAKALQNREFGSKGGGNPVDKERQTQPPREIGSLEYGQEFHPGQPGGSYPKRKQILKCKFHNGVVRGKIWSCCGNTIKSKPCAGNEEHIPRYYAPGEIEGLWQFHVTPISASDPSEIRRAVAIDCEMGSAMSGDSELIRITLVDYFSSSTLIDSLVYPEIPMEHYRTTFSGVKRSDMETARRMRTCIIGRDAARRAVWRYVGPDTVVVGHSASNDLAALRWIHPAVVDTFHIESSLEKKEKAKSEGSDNHGKTKAPETDVDDRKNEKEQSGLAAAAAAAQLSPAPSASAPLPPKPPPQATSTKPQQDKKKKKKGSGKLSLKTLALKRLGREIQKTDRKGHDSLEDALAARDLVHWHVVSGEIEIS